MGLILFGNFGQLRNFKFKNKISAPPLPPLPLNYVMHLDCNQNVVKNETSLISWSSTVGNITVTGVDSKPIINADGSIKFDNTHSANFNNVVNVRSVAAVMKYDDVSWKPSGVGNYNFFIFCGDTAIDFSGGQYTMATPEYSGYPLTTAPVYLNNVYAGVAPTVPLFYNEFKIVIVELAYASNRYNNIGRDRTYHSFAGNLKDLIVYDRVLTTQEKSDIYLHLKQKWNM